MTSPVRVGLVGCGRLAERGYLPALAGLEDLVLVAVADPDAARTALVAERAGSAPARFEDAAALLGGTEVDVVLIASPVGAHVDDARTAAAAGVPALLEKPPATDLDAARPLADLDPAPWLGFNRRFDPDVQALRAATRGSGPLDLHLRLRYRRSGWSPVQAHDDALLDLGPHLVDWARWLTGEEVRSVRRAEVTPGRAVVELDLDRSRARLEAAVDLPHEERVEVRDERGAVLARHRVGGALDGLRARLGRRGPDRLVLTLAAELAAVGLAVSGAIAEDGLGTVADGLAAMAVLDAARRSATDGRPTLPAPTLRPT